MDKQKQNLKETEHIPVMLNEVLKIIQPEPGKVYIDATLGGGGHFSGLIEKAKNMKNITLIGFDQDHEAIERFKQTKIYQEASESTQKELKIDLVNTNFEEIDKHLKDLEVKKASAILADLGTSQDQLEAEGRGFSFLREEPLDMRMSKDLKVTAADLVNGLTKKELVELFSKLADLYKEARKIAEAIVKERGKNPILTTKQLIDVIHQSAKAGVGSQMHNGHKKKHLSTIPAITGNKLEARVFQALRIAVNHELDSLKRFLPKAFEALEAKGKLVIISFHSGEDRIVKEFSKQKVEEGKAEYIKELLRPSPEELMQNSRSSSAKLRAIQKF